MMSLPTLHSSAIRRVGLSLLTAAVISLATAAPGRADRLSGIPSMDPEQEAPASADASLAAACREAARARLGGGDYAFGPPVFTTRDGQPTIRMNIRPADEASDPARLFRVACTRDPTTKEIQPVIFDASADRTGPRVILLQGPDPAIQEAAAPPERIVSTPSGPEAEDVGLGGYGWGPGVGYGYWGRTCWNCRPIVKPVPLTPNAFTILRRQPGVILRHQPGVVLRKQPGVVLRHQPGVVLRKAPVIVVRPAAPVSRFVFRFSGNGAFFSGRGGFGGHGMR